MREERTWRNDPSRAAWIGVALAIAGLILWGSLFRRPPGTEEVRNLDKVIHFAAYALLALTLCAGLFRLCRGWRRRYVVLLCVGLATVYGVCLECAQGLFVADRVFDLGDVTADFLGSVCAASVWGAAGKRIPFLS